jgi:chromate reductase
MSKVLMICGSLRKDSFNRKLMHVQAALKPAGMTLTESPTFAMPLYDADVQAKGFPAEANALADAVRAADGVLVITPEYNFTIPGGLKNAALAHEGATLRQQAGRRAVRLARPGRRRPHAI